MLINGQQYNELPGGVLIPASMVREGGAVTGPRDILPHLADLIEEPVECVKALYLDTRHRVIKSEIVTRGLLNSSQIHPREIFRGAITANAAAVIMGHNHPSGNLEPSKQDRHATKQVSEAGKIIGIPLLDHIIVSSEGFYSFNREGGLLP